MEHRDDWRSRTCPFQRPTHRFRGGSSPKTVTNKLQRVGSSCGYWSVVAGSPTAAWHSWYTPSFIGSTYFSVLSTNSAWSRDALLTILRSSVVFAAHCVPNRRDWNAVKASRQHLRSAASHRSAGSTVLSTEFLWTWALSCVYCSVN